MLLRLLLLCLALAFPRMGLAQTLDDLLPGLSEGDFNARAALVMEIARTGDPRASGVIEGLIEGELHRRNADGVLLRVTGSRGNLRGLDALTGEDLGPVAARSTTAIRVNNSLRRAARTALGMLTLAHPDPARRLAAAEAIYRSPDPEQITVLEAALAEESDARVIRALTDARALAVLNSPAGLEAKLAAIEVIAARPALAVRAALSPLRAQAEPALLEALDEAIAEAERRQARWATAQNIWFGLSLGSVLLLAAIGLAITFGVMGVINMAHGELVMLGAYTTFAVQQGVRAFAPSLFEYSLLIAAPAAFLVVGLVGVAIERGIVRHLYGRALETLLATWGVSLILQQAVRSIFGATNREVITPSWMSGSFALGEMTLTWVRVITLGFALLVFLGLLLAMKYSRFGLQIRAVTQNRPMAANIGIRTGRVDALTFGLGAGIAGLAGVALAQIDNVSPNLGQSYIIDSFLVVVFGGAGNLWGTFAAAFTLGITNKFLEPWAGAVLGKILILIFIILFIQKRPRGLFPQRGRAADA